MSMKSMAVNAIKNAGVKMVEKGAASVIRSMPKEKQTEAIVVLFVTGTVMMVFAGLMLMKRPT